MKRTLGLIIALLILGSCDTEYKPKGLRKLSNKEIIDNLVNNKVFNPAKIAYKNTSGFELTQDSLVAILKKGESFGDQYVNKNDSVVEMIVRPMVEKDKILLEQIDSVRLIMVSKNNK